MKTFTLKQVIGAFLVGLLIGLLISYYFFSNSTEPEPPVTIVTPEQIREREKEINNTFNTRISNLESKNAGLQKSLDSTKQQLEVLKQKTKKRAATIKKMVEPVGVPASSLIRKAAADTTTQGCDSLKKEVSYFLEEVELKDEAYQREIDYLTESSTNKDSIIFLLKLKQQEKDSLLATSVQQVELLMDENQQLRKKIKRRKFGATLKTIGLMIATGAAVQAINNL